MHPKPFSKDLEAWLKSSGDKTINSLSNVFAEKTFAILFLLLMFVPSLPLPTGGLTHIFEIIAMLVAFQLVIGRSSIWLPKSWKKYKVNEAIQKKAIPFIIKRIAWFERFARPRLSGLLINKLFLMLTGAVVFLLCLAAFLAPPFSGLDTLPSLGVVIIALALILEDAALFTLGVIIGVVGVGLIIGIGSAVGLLFSNLF